MSRTLEITYRVYSGNLIESEPSKQLFSECLPNINYYIAVISIALAIINQKRRIAPETNHNKEHPNPKKKKKKL